MDVLASFLGRNGYLPHGVCFTWTPGLLWAMVGADVLIASAYFSIPLAIFSFLRQRDVSAVRWVAWLFCAFIAACGITHVMDVWTIWQPDYAVQTLTKIVTAAISVVTAVALWRLIPHALLIPSVDELQATIGALEAEGAQRRSAEQTLAVAMASIGAGFIVTGRDGAVTRMNAVAEQLTGWPQAEGVGRQLWQVFQREGRPPEHQAMNPVDLVLALGVTVDTAHHLTAIARDGTRTEIEVKGAPIQALDGSVGGLVLVLRDRTRELRAEAESMRLAAIVESSFDAIIGTTLDGRITSWNAAAQTMFGHSADEAIGQPVQMLMPPQLAEDQMRIVAELSSDLRVLPFDTVRRAKDGSLLDVSVTISPIRGAGGRVVGASKIARDVSTQRRAEAALRDSENRLRFTLEAAQIGDWDMDLASGQLRRSPRYARCFGYADIDDDWDFETFMRHLHPDDRAEVARVVGDALDGRIEWRFECRVVWPDASVHWIGVHGSVLRDGGEPKRVVGIVSDLTQHKLSEQTRLKALQLEAENVQILQASRLKSQFLANMSHELRTPLNAVIGFADLLHTGAVPADSQRHHEFLGHIATSGRHLLQLINDVLDLSKVESGKFEFFPEPLHLPQLVREVGDILTTATQRKHIVLATELDPALTDLVLDAARLKQVLYNYLSNAIKFSPEGGRVTVRALALGPAHFRVEVEDSGIGIAEADLARLFIEFQQLDAGYSKQHQGTGLGLALTRRLVQAQGGSVGVRSVPGQGSVFHLVLPRQSHQHHPLPAEALPSLREGAAMLPMPSCRLLVIEPDLNDRTRAVRALTEAGFDVDAASTGEQALQFAQAHAYDAIALGLVMPDQHGLHLLASIREHGPSREAPVVGVTMSTPAERTASFAVADVLSKPIRSEEIVAAMARFRGAGSSTHPRRARVMVIDDDPLALDLMRSALGGIGIDAVCIADPRQALAAIDALAPDAVVLDLMMPGFDGFAVLDALQRMPARRDTPVFVWTSMVLTDEEYASLARSAQAVVGKGGGEFASMIDALRRWRPPVAVAQPGSGR